MNRLKTHAQYTPGSLRQQNEMVLGSPIKSGEQLGASKVWPERPEWRRFCFFPRYSNGKISGYLMPNQSQAQVGDSLLLVYRAGQKGGTSYVYEEDRFCKPWL
jgi:hypothetical protein